MGYLSETCIRNLFKSKYEMMQFLRVAEIYVRNFESENWK